MPTDSPPIPAEVWAAIQRRDAAWDRRLVYGVTSTGIFCRPSCPSRRPRRDRVRCFETPDLARGAGYRPCRRCRPESGEKRDGGVEAVARVRALLDADPDTRRTLEELARVAGLSPWHLQRIFRRLVGLSPREYQEARKAERLRRELRRPGGVSRAAYAAGFGSTAGLYQRAGRHLGMTPAAYGKGGAGMQIRYTIVGSPYGRLLVGVTERGVCAVSLGDRDEGLERELHTSFPRAVIRRVTRGDPWLTGMVRQVSARVRRPVGDNPVPLDLQGTVFQWRVWQALTAIPAGETRSYTELARAVGKPRAVRAVARACATNQVAVVVPCHRVVRADGSLGGYRWGLPRKTRLLEREGWRPT